MKEFTIIDSFFTKQNCQRKDVILPIGDDCAITQVPAGQQLAITTDTLVSGVHFPQDSSPEAIAHKSLAVSLSDLAAMGAEPAWINLSLSMPTGDPDWLARFSATLLAQCEYYSVQLIGGDTVQGPLVITITAHGFIPEKQAITRKGGKPGDLLYVTGCVGDAGLGLAIALDKHQAAAGNASYLRKRLDFPTPRVLAGNNLRRIASACIDISDGLLVDLQHILQGSGVGALLQLEHLPLSAELLAEVGQQQAIDLALTSGDDYELLFSVPQEQVTNLERSMLQCNVPVTCIGQLTGQTGKIQLQWNKQAYQLQRRGYQHFALEESVE